MRKCIERNENGQLMGHLPVEIGDRAKELAEEFFLAYPEVDTMDLMFILCTSAAYVRAMRVLKEAKPMDLGEVLDKS